MKLKYSYTYFHAHCIIKIESEGMYMIYHVSINGSDGASGTKEQPFRTINHAAKFARPGDTVQVHEGVYREWVDPQTTGLNKRDRIVYEAAPGEHPVIKGSEIVSDWEKVDGTVYKKVIPNTFFGDFNPYAEKLTGDWLQKPTEHDVHLGDVYVNGKSMFEATDMEALYKAERRETWYAHPLSTSTEYVLHPEDSIYQWRAVVDGENTTIYANFQDINPSQATIEINVRPTCFTPKRTGINYITVRGFEMAHAATQMSPPTAEQFGMINPNWSKGWIIENNHLHNSKCNAVCLGKDASTGNNYSSRFGKKSGHCYQFESVFNGLRAGWSKENIGSHLVRNNVIHDCGQTGIVGHMGCAFSRIEHNHIYNIGIKHEFLASEMAGIKFHAPIDVVIENNNIHNCTLGTWLDWQVQGARITRNLYYDNDRDFHIEVTHGPCTVDNNLFLSDFAMDNQAQGTAFVHNIFVGTVRLRKEMNRVTPYHMPHSTEVAGAAPVYGGDDRFINNLVMGKNPSVESQFGNTGNFSNVYDVYTTIDEYREELKKREKQIFNFRTYVEIPQPVWVEGNSYGGYASPYRKEEDAVVGQNMTATVEEINGEWQLVLDVPATVAQSRCEPVTTERLGVPRLTEGHYENLDGTPIDFTADYLGVHRDGSVIPGPFARLVSGKQRITVWKE